MNIQEIIKQKNLREAELKNPALAVARFMSEAREAINTHLTESLKEIKDRNEESLKQIEKRNADALEGIINTLKAEIPSLNLKGPAGDAGKDYVLTEKDKQEIAGSITVPVVDRIIEKREVVKIKEQPIYKTEVVKTIVEKEVVKHEDGTEIIKKLNNLEGVLDPSVIKGLTANIKALFKAVSERKREKGGMGGGGVGAGDIKVETPSGSINGSNTAYTVTKKITKVIGFAINGQYIHTSEYTTSGKTITFSTALPASLSGLGFTVVYV